MKCDRCSALISAKRGYCTTPVCNMIRQGGRIGDIEKAKPLSSTRDHKRCPFCSGDQGQYEGAGTCWLSTCDRGPEGRRCGCHYTMAGMTSPSLLEMPHLDAKRQPINPFQFARHVV